jgi:membrane associated rhomboid family serine protease|tara:strand:- start:1714 stop:2625 length:912 start_codon:yes stop_codon:yes gene_type:complete
MSTILEHLKKNFKREDSLTKLIYINVGVFLFVKIIFVFFYLFNTEGLATPQLKEIFKDLIISPFSIPVDISILIKKPWSIISYMFLHDRFMHLLFNMLLLYFGGQIFLSFFDNKKLLSTYILGGISGAILFIISFKLFPVFEPIQSISLLNGASASVLAIFIAIATKSPNYSVRLFFIGNIILKHIAVFFVLLNFLNIPYGNPGGCIAHLGGAFFGYLYVKQLNSGNDIASGFNKIIDYLATFFKSKPKLRKAYSRKKSDQDFRKEKVQAQAKIDKILDKIAKSGYEGLTKEEKDILFKASKK